MESFKESISRKMHDRRIARRRSRIRMWVAIMSGARRLRPNAAVGAGKVKVVVAKKGNKK